VNDQATGEEDLEDGREVLAKEIRNEILPDIGGPGIAAGADSWGTQSPTETRSGSVLGTQSLNKGGGVGDRKKNLPREQEPLRKSAEGVVRLTAKPGGEQTKGSTQNTTTKKKEKKKKKK